jgi:CRISPR-associated protein Csx17
VIPDNTGLPVVPIPGLPLDSLGNYLACLGLLRLTSRKWRAVRICWHDNSFQVVGGPSIFGELCECLMCVTSERSWTPYERGWTEAQEKSTKAKSGRFLALWQSLAEEGVLELLAAHAVPAARINFNPLLGSGGNAGKRDFADGWKKATDALASSIPSAAGTKNRKRKRGNSADLMRQGEDLKRKGLEELLLGIPESWRLARLNAASWFSDANKLYNSGQSPFREEALSPWAMALACEGLSFFAGGASRRLGARSYAVGAFPFVTRGAAPDLPGETGRELAEVWAPVWDRPMTLPEVRILFTRGRAEIHGRGCATPGAFAAAILRRGVDAGIVEFRRFVLGRTTSSNTFEPRFEGIFRVAQPSTADSSKSSHGAIVPWAFECLLDFVDRLPKDRKIGNSWRFVGLRGPIEAAMLRLAAAPNDPEAALAVLDAAVNSIDRMDRNRTFRQAHISWEPLPIGWLPALFSEAPSVEARLAMAMVSAFPVSRPFAFYRFGVNWNGHRFEHLERAPARWVWGPGTLPRVLANVLIRRTLDWEDASKSSESDEQPVRLVMPATIAQVSLWLDSQADEQLLVRWISRLALFNWSSVPDGVRSLARSSGDNIENAALCLFGLFQPLFDLRPIKPLLLSMSQVLDPKSRARTAGVARALASLLRAGQIGAAVQLSSNRYAMSGTPLSRMSVQWNTDDPERLLASLLLTVSDWDRAVLIERWLRPRRQRGDEAHA